jgi:type IV pilus assembly protein PilB
LLGQDSRAALAFRVMSTPRLRLGQLLVDARLITQDDLDQVLALQSTQGGRLGGLLVERGLIDETQLTQILSHQLAIPWVSLLHIDFSRQLLNLVPREVVERFCLVPIYVRHVRGQGDTLYVAMEDPGNEEALAACAAYSGLPVRSMIAPPTDIRSAIRVYYGGGRAPEVTPAPVAPAPAPPEPAAAAVAEPAEPAQTRSERPRSRRSIPAPSPAMPSAPEAPSREAPSVEPPKPPETHAAPEPQTAPVAARGPATEPPAAHTKRSGPRMVALTLLDGTTITLPARHRGTRSQPPPQNDDEPSKVEHDNQLTARDLVTALRAVSHGADATEILGEARWESMFAALLSLLLKKQLIADWEFVEELKSL